VDEDSGQSGQCRNFHRDRQHRPIEPRPGDAGELHVAKSEAVPGPKLVVRPSDREKSER
jgi:hypothetical protein